MRGFTGWLGGSIVAGLVILAAVAGAQQIPADKVPPKVMDAVKARFPGAEFTSITKETVDGQVIYDIELKQKGRKYEMDIKEDGTVLEVEKEVALKDVPAAVTKALQAKYPRSTVKEVMEVNLVKDNKETPDHYEMILEMTDKKTIELEVSLDGKTIKGPAEEKK